MRRWDNREMMSKWNFAQPQTRLTTYPGGNSDGVLVTPIALNLLQLEVSKVILLFHAWSSTSAVLSRFIVALEDVHLILSVCVLLLFPWQNGILKLVSESADTSLRQLMSFNCLEVSFLCCHTRQSKEAKLKSRDSVRSIYQNISWTGKISTLTATFITQVTSTKPPKEDIKPSTSS